MKQTGRTAIWQCSNVWNGMLWNGTVNMDFVKFRACFFLFKKITKNKDYYSSHRLSAHSPAFQLNF